MQKKQIAFILIALLIGSLSGYAFGYGNGFVDAIDIGLNFVEFEIDKEMIKNGIFNYENQIRNCFEPIEL